MRMAWRVGAVDVTVRWCAYSLLVHTSVSVVVRAHGKYIPHCLWAWVSSLQWHKHYVSERAVCVYCVMFVCT